ncbi:MAG: hypothetical protein ACKV0T_00200 [Planctomycetales bacterium]
MSVDLDSDEFTIHGPPFEWARLGGGLTIAEGSTRGWWQYIVPW